MKILVDMSLSPVWVDYFGEHGIDSEHWSRIGPSNALDVEITEFARVNHLVVFTHDLDFGVILALTGAHAPSVIQVRTQDPVPSAIGLSVVAAIRDYTPHLERGALVTVEPDIHRARILPLFRP